MKSHATSLQQQGTAAEAFYNTNSISSSSSSSSSSSFMTRKRSRSRSNESEDEKNTERRSSDDSHRHLHSSNSANRDYGYAPHQNVVLQGLSPEVTRDEIVNVMEKLQAPTEDIKLILDRNTNKSKGYAFVRFISVEHAKLFMVKHRELIQINGKDVRMKYSHGHAQPSTGEWDWKCLHCEKLNFGRRDRCFQCGNAKASKPVLDKPNAIINDGGRDVGSIPINMLLMRGMDPNITEDMIFQMFTGHKVKEVRLARSRATHISLGFAFIEFDDIQSSNIALTEMLERATSLLTMNGFKLKLSYAHQSSFSPVYVASPYASSWFTDPASGTTVYFMYWDPTAYTSKYPYTNAASGVGTFVAPAVSSSYKDGGNGETSKNMDDELNAFLADVAQEINSETAGAATSTSVAASATATAVVAEKKDTTFKIFEKKNAGFGSKKVKVQLQKWTERQQELREEPSSSTATTISASNNNVGETSSAPAATAASAADDPSHTILEDLPPPEMIDLSDEALLKRIPSELEINESHADHAKIACLLCQRQFKTADVLSKHMEKSDLHKTNMTAHVKKLVVELREKLEKEGAAQMQVYRNRAAERRKMHGQTRVDKNSDRWRRQVQPPPAPEQPTLTGIKSDNIGNRMLQKMGWKEGTGLGADGSGIVNPIKAEGYAKGAGLGSTPSGFPVGGVSDYNDKARMIARARVMDEMKQ